MPLSPEEHKLRDQFFKHKAHSKPTQKKEDEKLRLAA